MGKRNGMLGSLDFSTAGVTELRQYTLHPGATITLVDVFERHFIEGQEEAGIRIGGLYLDEADPDRFVWMRGFTDLAQRTEALQGFYFGSTWEAHREVANATMVDSDDVLLLRPTDPPHPPARAVEPTDPEATMDRIHLAVYLYSPDPQVETWLSTDVHRILEQNLATGVATWRSHPGPNSFPQLPVRQENAFVWAATFRDDVHRRDALNRLNASPEWINDVAPSIRRDMEAQHLDLRPTRRSRHPRPVAAKPPTRR